MFDLKQNQDRIVDAAIRLAASDGWSGLSLNRIAHEAGVSLNELRREFSSKAEILAAYTRAVDDAVLANAEPDEADAAPRDRLFDVLMTRFELMAPHRPALRRIKEDLQYHPGEGLVQLSNMARSMYWMLAAAGIDAEGSKSLLRVPGLLRLYARVFDIWIEDDDPGLSRTMAVLDRRLRRGEQAMQRIDDFGSAAMRFCAGILSRRPGQARAEAKPDEPPEPAVPDAPAAGQANGGAEPGAAPAM